MHTVSDEAIVAYLREFEAVWVEAEATLLGNEGWRLARSDFIGGRRTIHLSTSQGVAIEWESRTSSSAEIELNKGSASRADLLSGTGRRIGNLRPVIRLTSESHNQIIGVEIMDYLLFDFTERREDKVAILPSATFVWTVWEVRGLFRRNLLLVEFYANSHPRNWTLDLAGRRALSELSVAIADRAVAQQRGVSIAEYVVGLKERTVLVLGSYTEAGKGRIHTLMEAILERGYNPITPAIVEDVPGMSLPQKVTMLLHMARFVILEDTEPSGHLYEARLVEEAKVVVAVLRESGRRSSFMTAALPLSSKQIREWDYPPSEVGMIIQDVLSWAEGQFVEISRQLDTIYPWRNPLP